MSTCKLRTTRKIGGIKSCLRDLQPDILLQKEFKAENIEKLLLNPHGFEAHTWLVFIEVLGSMMAIVINSFVDIP